MGNKKDDSCRVQKSSFIPELGVFLTVSTKWGPVHYGGFFYENKSYLAVLANVLMHFVQIFRVFPETFFDCKFIYCLLVVLMFE